MYLDADLGGTELSKQLQSIFNNPISRGNKLRRIFILTDGMDFHPKKVISLIKSNSSTTMSNAIGIGYGVDKEMVKAIGKHGNGFFDFVLSGNDMRSKVIYQLDKSINGLCKIDISVENNPSIEIIPPLSEARISPNNFLFQIVKRFYR